MGQTVSCEVYRQGDGVQAICDLCGQKSKYIRGTSVKSRKAAAAGLRNVCPRKRANFYQEVSMAGAKPHKKSWLPLITLIFFSAIAAGVYLSRWWIWDIIRRNYF